MEPSLKRRYSPSISRVVLAWSVHVFTALGLLVAFMTLLAIVEHDFRQALLWMVVAMVIDGADGYLARLADVKTVVPHYNGQLLDWVTDFVNFAFLPAYLFYAINKAEPILAWLCVVSILFSSSYHFGNRQGVTADGHFRGFPAFWNVIVFYLVLAGLDVWINALIVAGVVVLHFIPVHFVYPTRMKQLAVLTWSVSLLTVVSAVLAAWHYPGVEAPYLLVSLTGLLVLFAIGCYLTVRTRLGGV